MKVARPGAENVIYLNFQYVRRCFFGLKITFTQSKHSKTKKSPFRKYTFIITTAIAIATTR